MERIQGRVLRILVADDSPVMRGIIRTLFAVHRESGGSELPAMELCGEAQDGMECVEMVKLLHPDVLLLDLEMPRMHGLGVLDRLRAESPELPVIMCSAYTELGARATVDALARGAADYVMKPSAQSDFSAALRVLSEQLLPKIAALADGRNRRRAPTRWDDARHVGENELPPAWTEAIVIGVSTGGPLALEVMLPMLPADLPVPVLIAQHMPKLFTGALAERLDRCCSLRVKEAYDGALAEAGVVWLAPGDMHMEVGLNGEVRRAGRESQRQVQVCLHRGQPVNYCRPSVDYLFNSAAQVYGAGTLAVVMTGMGADGLVGARSVHEAGGTVLTQDEASSVVWGMPGRVTEAGIASATLPLMSLGDELARRAWKGRSRRPAGGVDARVHTAVQVGSRTMLRVGSGMGRRMEAANVLF
jgi:two-component system chemotaxis response regulator CheB